ncbi:MAG: glycosyltransferase family 4 protein [Thermofilaceae archaeon]
MRILWINHRDIKHPEAGGAEVRQYEIAKQLVKAGHRVSLLCERVAGMPAREKLDGVEIVRLGNKYLVHLIIPLYVLRHYREFDVIIDDVAHAVPWYSPLVTKTPVIAQIHHVHQAVLDVEFPAFASWPIKQLERSVAKVYRNFITVSRSTKMELIRTFGIHPKRIAVVPNGVDLEKYKPGIKESKPTVLWVGRVKKYKRLDHLLEAFKIVKKKIPESQLVVIGHGENLYDAFKYAKKLELNDVWFLGKVDDKKKIYWMQRAWIIVSTSMVEGWGLVVTEAAACRTPAVAYRVPGVSDSIIDGLTGLLVSPGDIRELAEAIIRLLRDDDYRDYLGENALKRAQNYGWNFISKEFERSVVNFLYEENT